MSTTRLRGPSWLRLVVLALVIALVPSVAFARAPAPPPTGAAGSWVGELEGLAQ